MAALPLHGSISRSLGIRVHSMIQKPPYYTAPLHIDGRHGWSRKPSDQKPAIGPGNYLVGTPVGSSLGGGAPRFHGGGKFSPVAGGYWWGGGSLLKTNQDGLQKLDLSLKL
ncbi:hypothetical protein U1Q18_027059 [Sarracenia purpurea var. burkii]